MDMSELASLVERFVSVGEMEVDTDRICKALQLRSDLDTVLAAVRRIRTVVMDIDSSESSPFCFPHYSDESELCVERPWEATCAVCITLYQDFMRTILRFTADGQELDSLP